MVSLAAVFWKPRNAQKTAARETSSPGEQIDTDNLLQPPKQTKGLVWFSSPKENIASQG